MCIVCSVTAGGSWKHKAKGRRGHGISGLSIDNSDRGDDKMRAGINGGKSGGEKQGRCAFDRSSR